MIKFAQDIEKIDIVEIKEYEKVVEEFLQLPASNAFDHFCPVTEGDIAVKFENNEFVYHIPDGVVADMIINGTKQEVIGNGKILVK